MAAAHCQLPILFGYGPTALWLLLRDLPWRCRGGCGALLDGPGICPACAQPDQDRHPVHRRRRHLAPRDDPSCCAEPRQR